MNYSIRIFLALFALSSLLTVSQLCAQTILKSKEFKTPQNRVLVVSGGGARGAWGVGVCKALMEKHHGYKAVYGTSTGSLMAPMIMLQNIAKLEYNYTHVTQSDIFNLSPFKLVKEPYNIDGHPVYDSLTGTRIYNLKTEIKGLNAIWRLLWGKPSVGKSENLLKLIRNQFSKEEFNTMQEICIRNGFEIGVGVVDMQTSRFEMIKNTDLDYETFTNFMWASANQPVWMSYYYDPTRKSHFVDGGLIEVLPIRDAIAYAKAHNVDTIDVVLNNSLDIIDPKDFSIDKSYLSGGLLRLLATYGQATLNNNIELGRLHATVDSFNRVSNGSGSGRSIQINVYSMNRKLAMLYKDELGFDQDLMKMILSYGYVSTSRMLSSSKLLQSSPRVRTAYPTEINEYKIKR